MRTPTIPREIPMVTVVLLDENRENPRETKITLDSRAHRITIGKDNFDHCSTRDSDGAWEYEPTK